MDDLRQQILTNELGNILFDSIAPIYGHSKAVLYLFQAMGTMLEQDQKFIQEDFIAQIFPQTATWGLDYWEDQYGIVTDKTKSIEERRAYFMAMKFYRPPMTPKRIETMVSSLTGFDCIVDDTVAPNTFSVTMYGYPENMKSVYDLLDKKTPAHLIYTVKGIERIETISETFPVVIGDFSEHLGEINVAAYSREAEIITTTASVFQAVAVGNVAEKMGEIEVIN